MATVKVRAMEQKDLGFSWHIATEYEKDIYRRVKSLCEHWG